MKGFLEKNLMAIITIVFMAGMAYMSAMQCINANDAEEICRAIVERESADKISLRVMEVELGHIKNDVKNINDKLNFLTGLKDNPFEK